MNLFLQKQKNIAAKTHPPKKDQQKYSLLHMTRTAREWSPIVAVCRATCFRTGVRVEWAREPTCTREWRV